MTASDLLAAAASNFQTAGELTGDARMSGVAAGLRMALKLLADDPQTVVMLVQAASPAFLAGAALSAAAKPQDKANSPYKAANRVFFN